MSNVSIARTDVQQPTLLQEDATVLAAKYKGMHEETMQQLNDALAQAKAGTATYLNYLIAREKLESNYLDVLMNLGLISRAPINYNVERYEFKATVGLDPNAAQNSRTVPFLDAEYE